MKKTLLGLFLGVVAVLCVAAFVKQTGSIYIENSATGNEPKIKIRADDQTVNWFEIVQSGTNLFSIPVNGILGVANGGTGTATGAATTSTSSANSTNLYGRTFPPLKLSFSTNYTAAITDGVLFCTGTNQIITLPNCTTSPSALMLTVISASTTGSVIVTNSTGAQLVQGSLSSNLSSTNKLTVINDGSNWW